jgi:hypothetical protein
MKSDDTYAREDLDLAASLRRNAAETQQQWPHPDCLQTGTSKSSSLETIYIQFFAVTNQIVACMFILLHIILPV